MLKAHEEDTASHEDGEDGIIPDSPISSISANVVSRMRRRKLNKHIRYTERTQDESEISETTNGNLHDFFPDYSSDIIIQNNKNKPYQYNRVN